VLIDDVAMVLGIVVVELIFVVVGVWTVAYAVGEG